MTIDRFSARLAVSFLALGSWLVPAPAPGAACNGIAAECRDGRFSAPFAEPTLLGVPTTEKCVQAADGQLACKPAAGTLALLADDRLIYFNALEGTENVELSIVAEFGTVSANDQTRVLSFDGSGNPGWTRSTPVDAGANPDGSDPSTTLPATKTWSDIAYAGLPLLLNQIGLQQLSNALNPTNSLQAATLMTLLGSFAGTVTNDPGALLTQVGGLLGLTLDPDALETVIGSGMRGSTFSVMLPQKPDSSGQYRKAEFLTAGGVPTAIAATADHHGLSVQHRSLEPGLLAQRRARSLVRDLQPAVPVPHAADDHERSGIGGARRDDPNHHPQRVEHRLGAVLAAHGHHAPRGRRSARGGAPDRRSAHGVDRCGDPRVERGGAERALSALRDESRIGWHARALRGRGDPGRGRRRELRTVDRLRNAGRNSRERASSGSCRRTA
jgi:hypothetical protein